MSQDIHISLKSIEFAKNQVKNNCKPAIFECIAIQKDRINDAEKRIKKEGIVVRDMKGSVIQHPAIKISQDAMKIMLDIIKKYEPYQ